MTNSECASPVNYIDEIKSKLLNIRQGYYVKWRGKTVGPFTSSEKADIFLKEKSRQAQKRKSRGCEL